MLTQERTREGGVRIEDVVGEVYRFEDGLWGIRRPAWNETDGWRRPPMWYKLDKRDKRRLRKQRRLARLGRPVTLRDLADKEGLMLFRAASKMLPDAVLFESIDSAHYCRDVRWIGTGGWKAIRRALWGKSLPAQRIPKPIGNCDPRNSFSAQALFEKWGIWAVSRAYAADAGPSTKVLRVTAKGTIEVIGHWAKVPWPMLKKLFAACERLGSAEEAIAEVIPPPLVQIEPPKGAKRKRTYKR
jgi:hypothetical protein